MDYIRLLAKLGRYSPGLGFIAKYLVTSEFEIKVNALYPNDVRPTHIIGGVLVVGSVTLGLVAFILNFWVNTLSAVILSVTLASMCSLLLINSISSKYNRFSFEIEKHAPYVLEELTTIFLATGSVFESIRYVAGGGYNQISNAFSQMIDPLNQGVKPEQLIMQFADNQPSATLRRGLLAFIQLIETSNDSIDAVICDAHGNLQRHYEKLTIQWESRMTVYSGLLIFLPIIILLGAAIRGLAENPLILLLPVFQFGLSKILQKILLPSQFILLGE